MTDAQATHTESFKRIGNLGVPTCRILALMEGRSIGDEIGYNELIDAHGDLDTWESSLRTAISIRIREHGEFWQRIRGERCIRRMNGPETVGTARAALKGVSKRARRIVRVLGTVDVAALDNVHRATYAATLAVAASISVVADANHIKRLEASPQQIALTHTSVLAAMTGESV